MLGSDWFGKAHHSYYVVAAKARTFFYRCIGKSTNTSSVRSTCTATLLNRRAPKLLHVLAHLRRSRLQTPNMVICRFGSERCSMVEEVELVQVTDSLETVDDNSPGRPAK